MPERLKMDLHVHTVYSDSSGRLEDIVRVAVERGLDGIAITDHNTCEAAALAIRRYSDRIIVVPGLEYDAREGHLLALGLVEALPTGLSAPEISRHVHKRGALVVVPHPNIPLLGMGREEIEDLRPDAIETLNSAMPFYNWLSRRNARLADSLRLPQTGGSDSHDGSCVGDSYTVIESDSRKMGDILKAIKDGRTTPEGRPSPMFYRARLMAGALLHRAMKGQVQESKNQRSEVRMVDILLGQ